MAPLGKIGIWVIGILIGTTMVAVAAPTPYDYGDPTAEEQAVLERVNAYRVAPDDFAAQFGYAPGTYAVVARNQADGYAWSVPAGRTVTR